MQLSELELILISLLCISSILIIIGTKKKDI